MADQRILSTEEMVGSGHATKADTLNRLALIEHENDGTHTSITLGTGKSIHDTDNDTKIQVEESADEDKIRMDVGGTEAAILDADGLRLPTNAAFCASVTSEQANIAVGSNVKVVFGTEVYDIGGNFAANTFTAPVDGKYILATSILLEELDTGSIIYTIFITTSNRSYQFVLDTAVMAADAAYNSMALAIVADMDAADTAVVEVKQNAGAVQTDIASGYFTGALIC